MRSQQPTRLQRDEVLAWFDGLPGFEAAHRRAVNVVDIAPLVADDFD